MKKIFLAVVAFGAVFIGQMESVRAYGYGSSYGSSGSYSSYNSGSSYSSSSSSRSYYDSWFARTQRESEDRREAEYRARMDKIHRDSNAAIGKHFEEINSRIISRTHSFGSESSTPSSARVKFVHAKVATFCAPGVNNKERCDRYCGELNEYGIKNKLCPVIAKNKK